MTGYLGIPDETAGDPDSVPIYSRNLGRGIRDQLAGVLCYRLAGRSERAALAAAQGHGIVEDVLEHDDQYPPQRHDRAPSVGSLHEMGGDLRLFAGEDAHADAYDEAARLYAEAESPLGWQAEDEFSALIDLLLALADEVGYEIEERTRGSIADLSLEDRIAYKRDHYAKIYRQVLDHGSWTSD